MERGLRGMQGVEAPEPLLAHIDEPRAAEVVQVVGRLGLGHLQNRDDVADADLAVLEEVQDA